MAVEVRLRFNVDAALSIDDAASALASQAVRKGDDLVVSSQAPFARVSDAVCVLSARFPRAVFSVRDTESLSWALVTGGAVSGSGTGVSTTTVVWGDEWAA